jgi:hypothetical protein
MVLTTIISPHIHPVCHIYTTLPHPIYQNRIFGFLCNYTLQIRTIAPLKPNIKITTK